MFSPSLKKNAENAPTPTVTTRGRRRQRPASSENTAQQPKAKRSRIALNEQTFVQPDANANVDNFEVKAARPQMKESKQDGIENTPPTIRKELSVRSKKAKGGDRVGKGDGSLVLTSNSGFVVSKLPALPERLRADATSRQHGSVDAATGFALSLTQTHAVVWPYTSLSQTPADSFVFTLPYPSKHATDPLPIGSLVSSSVSSSETGLVIVMPTSGKITYWESITSATTLDFMRQQRNGVEDTIPGMYSGETVTQIIRAESTTGFVLSFSSGRMAYLSVRDAHGRPQISVQFLRTSLAPKSGGIFGSIRNVLSQTAVQGDIAAVRSDRSSKQGERTIVAATSKGRLHAWKIHRGGHHDLLTEYDAKEAVIAGIRERDLRSIAYPADSFKIHDFTYTPATSDEKYVDMTQLRHTPASDTYQHLLLLTSFSNGDNYRYVLAEVLLPNGASPETPVIVGAIRPITSFSTPPNPHALAKPRLYLPKPAVVAFVVFDRAIVVASIARQADSPDSQLLEDSHILPANYEDVVDLRQSPVLEVVGSGIEEPHAFGTEEARSTQVKTKNPSVVLLVRGVGTLRVLTTDIDKFPTDKAPEVTAKSKLEQAVFFGIKEDNPLVFDAPRELPFSDEEIGNAALELSNDILSSNNSHLAAGSVHLESHLKFRARTLEKLMSHLKNIKVSLDRVTRWKLLWNAEKLHAASYVWKKHEEFLNTRSADSKKDLAAEIVEYIRTEEKHQPDVSRGEIDQLRYWFTHDTDRMNIFLAWAYEVIKYNSKAELDQPSLTRFICEAMQMNIYAIREAMEFRKRNLPLYGLEREKMENGILAENYEGLPQPWTSDQYITNNLKRLVELASEWANQNYVSEVAGKTEQMLVQQIRTLLPALTEVYLTALQELSRSSLASSNSKTVTLGQSFEETYEKDRHEKVILLAQSENWEAAVRLAEQHRSLAALAEIMVKETESLRSRLTTGALSPEETQQLEDRMKANERQVEDYFAEYGKDFAFPFYDYLLSLDGIDAVLEYSGDKIYKTSFLRTKPELAKISWINDIIGEEDIVHAADTLLDLGLAREQQIWNKKIELSLGKLARMAEASRPSSKASFSRQEATINVTVADAGVDAIDRELAIIKIQDQLYGQVRPVVSVALDEAAELPMALEAFPIKIPKKYKILTELYENGLARLLKHEALDPMTLIDLLTMIQLQPDLKEMISDQFFLAIQVANYALVDEEREQAERLIWRRCYLREDWTKINNTSHKDDNDVLEILGSTDLFSTFCVLYASQQSADGKPYRRVMPSEALGVYTETLDQRFQKLEKGYGERYLEAMRWEDSNLKKHVEKHRLEQWAQETRRLAEDTVNQQYDQQTAEGATQLSPPPSKLTTANGHSQNGAH
ncbi:nuclear pore complex [Apiospora arundinis]